MIDYNTTFYFIIITDYAIGGDKLYSAELLLGYWHSFPRSAEMQAKSSLVKVDLQVVYISCTTFCDPH